MIASHIYNLKGRLMVFLQKDPHAVKRLRYYRKYTMNSSIIRFLKLDYNQCYVVHRVVALDLVKKYLENNMHKASDQTHNYRLNLE